MCQVRSIRPRVARFIRAAAMQTRPVRVRCQFCVVFPTNLRVIRWRVTESKKSGPDLQWIFTVSNGIAVMAKCKVWVPCSGLCIFVLPTVKSNHLLSCLGATIPGHNMLNCPAFCVELAVNGLAFRLARPLRRTIYQTSGCHLPPPPLTMNFTVFPPIMTGN